MVQNSKKHKISEIVKFKNQKDQVQKSKQQLVSETAKIEKELPQLEKQFKEF